MKRTKTAMMGLLSAAALALGVQQSRAADIVVSNNVDVDTTWTSNNVYKLDRLIFVKSGATLTIQAGTVIRGLPIGPVPQEPGTLCVSRGGKINAQGTAQNPIIFTDQYDDNIGASHGSVGPNGINYGKLNNQLTGQWGGLILAGRSYIAWDSLDSSGIYTPDSRVQSAIEGLASTNDLSYGGSDDLDNSGNLNYVSIRYGGFILGPSKEINGLTLCGVGRGTTIDHIDIYNTKDDNIECFGGTAGLKHLLGWNGTDDQLDTDTGWRGKVQFALMVQGISTITGPGQALDSSDKGLEWDGAGDSTGFNDDPQSCGTMFNFTFIGLGTNCGDTANTFANIRDNGGARLYNGIVMDFAGGCTLIEGVTNRYVVAGVTNAAWTLGQNCSAMKLFEDYGQDSYFSNNVNKQGIQLTGGSGTNYIGYADPIAGSKKLEIKRVAFWNMGIPHSIGMTNGFDTTAGKLYCGTDNSRFSTHAHAGFFPINTGYDVVAPGNTNGDIALDNVSLPAPLFTPIAYYARETNVYNVQPTFRPVPHPYTCVKQIDPRANTNFWSIIATYGAKPPADGFFTPVQFAGAMGKKNWAGPWSTPWRLGGMVTNGVATGDETGIVPTIGSGAGVVNIALNPDTYAGVDADFWLVAVKTSGAGAGNVYYFNLGTGVWTLGLVVTYQSPLFALASTPISVSSLTAGQYDVYFGVDLLKNAILDFDQLYVSSVHITR